MLVKYFQDSIILQPENVTGGYDHEDIRENCVRRMPIINWMPYEVWEVMAPQYAQRHERPAFFRHKN